MNTIEGEGGESKRNQGYDDPRIFLADFEQSSEYRDAFEYRLKELRCPESDQGQKDLIRRHFPGRDNYKQALWGFLAKHPLHFKAEIYPPEFLEKVNEYWRFIEDNQKQLDKTGEDFGKADTMKMSLHSKAAQQLVDDGWFNDFTTARQIVHFLSIDKGVDVVDLERDERRLAAEASRIIDEEEKAA